MQEAAALWKDPARYKRELLVRNAEAVVSPR
jgi:hypothetical protein